MTTSLTELNPDHCDSSIGFRECTFNSVCTFILLSAWCTVFANTVGLHRTRLVVSYRTFNQHCIFDVLHVYSVIISPLFDIWWWVRFVVLP